VRAALAVSRNLIVLCSPNSAASPWVAKEISTFRELHPDRPIFTAIVEGEPDQCFCPVLLEGGAEPLAADLRKGGDGRRLGLLKLVAGLAGVGLDALVQRDAQRRIRRVTYVTAAAVSAMLAMALLMLVALNARAEAQRQHAEAEGMVEFMLTDLRLQLKGVGRLDIMSAVNERALAHYGHQKLGSLSADSLVRRARILHAIGEDDLALAKPSGAVRAFQEAYRTTSTLLERSPDDPVRIFAHSQSEFWIGSVDYQNGAFAKAKLSFDRYKALADRLVELDPGNAKYLQEAAYAEGSLCSISLGEPIDKAGALQSCAAALARMTAAARRSDDPSALQADLANRHAWLADAWYRNGSSDKSREHREAQEKILEPLIARDPKNMDLRDLWVTNQMSLAGLDALAGSAGEARARLRRTMSLVDSLVRLDPSNRQWAQRRSDVQGKLNKLSKAGE
ncbi:MAG: hypothetical protein ABIW83_08955, partial [Allosphingosinicella sp.]